ncbi:MAG: hypothetical protein VKN33_06125 [Candidatus Sericytochromatia bacterium]|nr:hypothetical protein [Candidatus Sericytochromatia bacterium]
MSDKPAGTKAQDDQRALQEAQVQLQNLKGHLSEATKAATDAISPALQAAQGRLAEAQEGLAAATDMRQKLEAFRQEPALSEDYDRMVLLERLYTQMKVFASAEIGIWERNLARLNAIPQDGSVEDYTEPSVSELVMPASDPEYLLHRTLLDVAMLGYHWHRNRMAIDVVLRAAGNELRSFRANEAGETHLTAQANILREAASRDRELAMALGSLGSVFEETYALLDWGQTAAETLAQLPVGARNESLADADWAKLNGGLVTLLEINKRVANQPLLAKLFSEEG